MGARRWLMAALAAGAVVSTAAHGEVADGSLDQTLSVGGQARRYLLHRPSGHDARVSGPRPLVLVFSEAGADPARLEQASGLSALADRQGFVVAYLGRADGHWQIAGRDGADVQFSEALVRSLVRQRLVDPHRVYAAGLAEGAQMAWRLACDRPKLLAAVAVVSGGYPSVCDGPRPDAVVFHGTADRRLPYAGETGGGGEAGLMPVRGFARAWVDEPGCEPPAMGLVFLQRGGAVGERWRCGERVVELYTLQGKGSGWPGSTMAPRLAGTRGHDVDATTTIWAFFDGRRRP